MKIILLLIGLWIFKISFRMIAENPLASLWLVPVVFAIGMTVALLGFKMIWEKI